MPAEIPTPISHPGETTSNEIRRRLAKVEPHALRTFTPSLAVLAKSAGSYHWTPEGHTFVCDQVEKVLQEKLNELNGLNRLNEKNENIAPAPAK